MPDVFVVSAVRSAIGRFGGAFRDLVPPALAGPGLGAAPAGGGGVDLTLAGGMETMSSTGFYQDAGTRWGHKYAPAGVLMFDLMARDGLSDPESGEAMGLQTEQLIAEEGVTRAELDDIAVLSHRRGGGGAGGGGFGG